MERGRWVRAQGVAWRTLVHLILGWTVPLVTLVAGAVLMYYNFFYFSLGGTWAALFTEP